MQKTAIIILAAGTGKRLKASRPKQFVVMHRKPLIIHTVLNMRKTLPAADIYVACHPSHRVRLRALFEAFHIRPVTLIDGGPTRTASLFNVLAHIEALSYAVIAVHDAARPFISRALIRRLFSGLLKADCCIPILPVRYTIKEFKPGKKPRTLDRKDLYEIQTPQVFRGQALLTSYRHCLRKRIDLRTVYDDAQLMEYSGGTVRTVRGNHENIKVTYPFDIQVGEALFRRRNTVR